MDRNNDVSKVLVTKGDQAVLAKNLGLDNLNEGQVGFFNAKTNTSIDKTVDPVEKAYVAVGVQDGINTSAGQFIHTKDFKLLSYKKYKAPTSKIVVITGYETAECDQIYNGRFELRDQQIYRTQGNNQFMKGFSVKTPCCIGDEKEIDANILTKLIVEDINANPSFNRALEATITARTALLTAQTDNNGAVSQGGNVSEVQYQGILAYNKANPSTKVFTDVTVTISSLPLMKFCNVNLKYFHPRMIQFLTSLDESMTCIGGKVEVKTEMVFEEGNGYDIKQKEYHSQAEGSPYVVYTIPGVAREREFFTDEKENYDQFILEYDLITSAGWRDYENVMSTVLAVPTGDTTTRNGVADVLDKLYSPLLLKSIKADVLAGRDVLA